MQVRTTATLLLSAIVLSAGPAVANTGPNTTINDNRDPRNGNGSDCPVGSELVQASSQNAFDSMISEAQADGTFVQEPSSSRAASLGFCRLTNTNENDLTANPSADAEADARLEIGANALSPSNQATQILESNPSLSSDIATALESYSDQEVITALESDLGVSNDTAQALVNSTRSGDVASENNQGTVVDASEEDNSVTRVTYENPRELQQPILFPGIVTEGTSGQSTRLSVVCLPKDQGPAVTLNFAYDVFAANEGQDIRAGVTFLTFGIQGGYTTTENGEVVAPLETTDISSTLSGINDGSTRRNNCGDLPVIQTTVTPPAENPEVEEEEEEEPNVLVGGEEFH